MEIEIRTIMLPQSFKLSCLNFIKVSLEKLMFIKIPAHVSLIIQYKDKNRDIMVFDDSPFLFIPNSKDLTLFILNVK